MDVSDLVDYLQTLAPLPLAEDWDNVGLLLGRMNDPVTKVMTCLTLTPDVAEEAIRNAASCVVSHHPILFRPVQQLTSATSEGRMLLDLMQAGIAVYSPHTSFDSAPQGINRQLAAQLGARRIQPLRPLEEDEQIGAGRCGDLARRTTLETFVRRVRKTLPAPHLQVVGEADRPVQRVAVACGAAAGFMTDAARCGCDVLVTGEARFHECLQARSLDIALVIAGHYATERPAVESLADVIQQQFSELHVWASEQERDPISWY